MAQSLYRAYLVVPPGLESLAINELRDKVIFLKMRQLLSNVEIFEAELGGFEIESDLSSILILQRYLKIPSRILLRFAEFKAFEFPQLLKQLGKQDWSIYQGMLPQEVNIASSKSRLGQEKRILKVFHEYFQKIKSATQGEAPNLYVRVFRDVFTLSLDLSGEHLHFRGYRSEQGTAPLRENFAAALLAELLEDLPLNDYSKLKIVDPFMGSGTLLAEAFLLYQPVVTREFSGEALKKISIPKKSEIDFEFYYGVEIDKETFEKAQRNLQKLKIPSQKLKLVCGDNHKLFTQEIPQSLLICNPPYGDRLKADQGQIIQRCTGLMQNIRPLRAGFLVPAKWEMPEVSGFIRKQSLSFKNNGLPVQLALYYLSKGST